MKTCGIIAEYNPFHNGHKLHIDKTRERLGDDTLIVCCMSGNYVQRGEAALLERRVRAKMAVEGGADLVLSLPLRWSLSSAQGFAEGAVHILSAVGADYLSFGAEDDNIEDLKQVAGILAEKSLLEETIAEMSEGVAYARARERAVHKHLQEKAELLRLPNNILALEYLRAIKLQGSCMEPVAVKRTGAGHDEKGARGAIASASYIRALVREGQTAETLVPPGVAEGLAEEKREGRLLDDMSRLDCAMTAHFAKQTAEGLAKLPDAAEGLENRLYQAMQQGSGFEEICALAKTKRYAMSRLRRMLFCSYLGIERRPNGTLPGFTQVLAFNDHGRALLAQNRENDNICIITKPADAKRLPPESLAELELEVLSARLYDMALPGYVKNGSQSEWKKGPLYINGR